MNGLIETSNIDLCCIEKNGIIPLEVVLLSNDFYECFLTGSRAFGYPTNASDVDIVVKEEDFPKIIIEADRAGYFYDSKKGSSPDHRAHYLSKNGALTINLIITNQTQFLIWKNATDIAILARNNNHPDLKDRSTRVKYFKKLRGYFEDPRDCHIRELEVERNKLSDSEAALAIECVNKSQRISELESVLQEATKQCGGFVQSPFDGSLNTAIQAISMRCGAAEQENERLRALVKKTWDHISNMHGRNLWKDREIWMKTHGLGV